MLVGNENGRKKVVSRKTVSLPGRSSFREGPEILLGLEFLATELGEVTPVSGVGGLACSPWALAGGGGNFSGLPCGRNGQEPS